MLFLKTPLPPLSSLEYEESLEHAKERLQTAIDVEFATLPPYLYALYTIKPGMNSEASNLLKSIAMEEMIHMCLACNMLNAIGGSPLLTSPQYPSKLLHLAKGEDLGIYPFSKKAIEQGILIETPMDGGISYKIKEPIDRADFAAESADTGITTIGQLYADIRKHLENATEKGFSWPKNTFQIRDAQFLQGDIFAIESLDDAKRAIDIIVEEGEGSNSGPLDLKKDYAHYYKFSEIYNDGQLTTTENVTKPSEEYVYQKPLGVDWSAAYPAISNPQKRDFSGDPKPARDAQDACNRAYTHLVQNLRLAVTSESGALGVAARNMFDLRMAAQQALSAPLADGKSVAGPAFKYDAKFEIERAA